MMKDIDRRLKELDEEEERQKEEMRQKMNSPKTDEMKSSSNVELPKPHHQDLLKENANEKLEENKMKEAKEESNINKPKINVDADSIIVNDNVITDDEFFDDFFNE